MVYKIPDDSTIAAPFIGHMHSVIRVCVHSFVDNFHYFFLCPSSLLLCKMEG